MAKWGVKRIRTGVSVMVTVTEGESLWKKGL